MTEADKMKYDYSPDQLHHYLQKHFFAFRLNLHHKNHIFKERDQKLYGSRIVSWGYLYTIALNNVIQVS